MELRHLRYFVAVAEEQNVTRAAARLHVSQPPLSRQIRDLEDELGVQLFERRPQALRLTEAGRLFLIEARAILARADEAVRSVQAQAAGGSRELHVGYAPSLAAEFLPAALAQWRTQAPRTRVVLHDLATEEMLVALREERLHAGLLVRPPAAAQRGLNFAELKRYRVAVAMNPAHRLGRTARPTLEQVARESLTVYARKDYPEYLDWVSGVLRPTGQAPRIATEVDSASSLVTALEADDSVALVQEGFECFSGARLLVRPVEPPPASLVVGLAWRRSAAAEIKGLLAALQEAVGRVVPRGGRGGRAGE